MRRSFPIQVVVTTTDAAGVVQPMMADPRLRKISFTGSTRVGKLLLGQAAEHVLRPAQRGWTFGTWSQPPSTRNVKALARRLDATVCGEPDPLPGVCAAAPSCPWKATQSVSSGTRNLNGSRHGESRSRVRARYPSAVPRGGHQLDVNRVRSRVLR
ncbi:aldehyde dehydrogenase family protein [Saccharopolyspora phatthalungensis]|uniref:aldehyde dehydrogenase family protein n=1 Tax=Saccharopolyspora phatthalungensis TaxID=664693 RepID=UPI0028A8C0D9|nr:aldehyde dehydrogenase family protein [Saccharopolyspora phatthalungensis]